MDTKPAHIEKNKFDDSPVPEIHTSTIHLIRAKEVVAWDGLVE